MEVENLAEDWIFGRVTKPKDPSYLELCQPPTAWYLASIHFGWMVHLWADGSFASRTSTAITPHRKLRLRWSDNTDFETDGNYESRRFLLWAAASTGIPKSSSIQSIQIPFKFHSNSSIAKSQLAFTWNRLEIEQFRVEVVLVWRGLMLTTVRSDPLGTNKDRSLAQVDSSNRAPILATSLKSKLLIAFRLKKENPINVIDYPNPYRHLQDFSGE